MDPLRVAGGAIPGEISRAQLPRLADQAADDAWRAYRRREAELGRPVLAELQQRVIFSVLDRGWREHLQAMPELLTGISTRTAGPAGLAEYRRESTLAFNRMRAAANRAIVQNLFYVRVDVEPSAAD